MFINHLQNSANPNGVTDMGHCMVSFFYCYSVTYVVALLCHGRRFNNYFICILWLFAIVFYSYSTARSTTLLAE